MEVGIRELKMHLAAYLERAAKGERIVVTDRGRPKATLGPVVGQLRLQEGLDEGWIRAADTSAPHVARRYRSERSTAEVLGEDRDT